MGSFLASLIAAVALSGHPTKHNFFLMGTSEVFASHVVATDPHHYQIMMKVTLDEGTLATYRAAKLAAPGDTFLLLLDPVDLDALATATELTGTLRARGEDGVARTVATGVRLPRAAYEILYFNELPKDLSGAHH